MFLLPNGLRVKFSSVFAICSSLVLMLAVVGIFAASWQGKLGVSWVVSDGLLAFLGD